MLSQEHVGHMWDESLGKFVFTSHSSKCIVSYAINCAEKGSLVKAHHTKFTNIM